MLIKLSVLLLLATECTMRLLTLGCVQCAGYLHCCDILPLLDAMLCSAPDMAAGIITRPISIKMATKEGLQLDNYVFCNLLQRILRIFAISRVLLLFPQMPRVAGILLGKRCPKPFNAQISYTFHSL
jgi:hypothetical protein